jgi:hypothetical protein
MLDTQATIIWIRIHLHEKHGLPLLSKLENILEGSFRLWSIKPYIARADLE